MSAKKTKTVEAEIKRLEAAFKAVQERVQALVGDLQKVSEEGGIVSRNLWQRLLADKDKAEVKTAFAAFFKQQADLVASGFNVIAEGWAALMQKGAESATLLNIPLERMGLLAEAAFGAMLAKGASLLEAMTALSPGLDQIVAALEKSGQTATGMLAQLLGWRAIIDQNKELFQILAGVDQMLTGLANTGLLTQETFTALTQTMSEAFTSLTSQGVSAEDALRMMAPQLQKLWELQREWGFEIDATTQAMLDQAVEQGIVGEKMKSVDQKILDVLLAIAEVMGAKIPEGLKAMGDAAAEAGRRVTDELGKIQPPVLRGKVYWDVETIPVPEVPDATAYAGEMAVGGIVSRPTLATIGEAGPEAVIPLSKLERWLERLVPPEGAATPGSTPVVLNVTINALDTKSMRDAVIDDVVPILEDVYRGNIRGARTSTRLALGVTGG